jgi:hypothetical protein
MPVIKELEYEAVLDLFCEEIQRLLISAMALYTPTFPLILPPARARRFKISARVFWPACEDVTPEGHVIKPDYVSFECPALETSVEVLPFSTQGVTTGRISGTAPHQGNFPGTVISPPPGYSGTAVIPTATTHTDTFTNLRGSVRIGSPSDHFLDMSGVPRIAKYILEDCSVGGLNKCVRALEAIRAAKAWCDKRQLGRMRHLVEIMSQQKRSVETLQSEIALHALDKAGRKRK